MRSVIFSSAIVVILLVSHFASGQTKYDTYDNQRFHFSIEYPSDLLKMIEPPPTNGDGRIFRSKDNSVELRAWGQHNALMHSLAAEYSETVGKYGSAVTYKKLMSGGFVISGNQDGKIFYQKTLFRKDRENAADIGVFFTFTIEYPKKLKKKLDPVVKRIAKSFRFDPNAEI